MKELLFGMAVGLVTGAALASYNKQIKDLMNQAKTKIDDMGQKLCDCIEGNCQKGVSKDNENNGYSYSDYRI